MTKFEFLITLDYELPVNKKPDVMRHIVKPTDDLLRVCEQFGVKVTVMVEIGELWAFEKERNRCFAEYLGYDPGARIRDQLVDAVTMGHDVQLHLHPQWLNARWEGAQWHLDYSKYRVTDLDYGELVDVLRAGKEYLETLLRPHCEHYRCLGFRSGNWITQPSAKYLGALHEAGLRSDTSVFKWGYRNTPSVYLDYRNAYSNILPWAASWDDINRPSEDGGIVEFPIYAEPASIFGMLSFRRLKVAADYLREDRKNAGAVRTSVSQSARDHQHFWNKARRVFGIHSKKLDFCKLSKREMLQMFKNVWTGTFQNKEVHNIPIVMIGHSKDPISSVELGGVFAEVSKLFGDSLEFVTYRQIIPKYLALLTRQYK
jgi:hypothetical protein